jgi:hypothetical protein
MRALALFVAFVMLVVGITGLFFPEALFRAGHGLATPTGLWVATGLRIAIGLVLILAAAGSRAPKTLRIIGIIAIVAGVATPMLGIERTRAILDWWPAQSPVVMRLGPALVLALGAFIACTVAPRRSTAP